MVRNTLICSRKWLEGREIESGICHPTSVSQAVNGYSFRIRERLKAANGEGWAPPFICCAVDNVGLLPHCLYGGGGRVVRWCWVNFQCRGVLLIWIIVGQGPTALAVGAGGGCLDILSLVYHSLFFLPLSGRRPKID